MRRRRALAAGALAAFVVSSGACSGARPGPSPATAAETPPSASTSTSTSTSTTVADPDRMIPGRFRSAEADAGYEIYVHLPDGYAESGDRYPVVYVLDADWYFDGTDARLPGGVVGIVAAAVRAGDLPPVLLVGIGYPDANERGRDFLAAPERFHAFLVQELIPAVDARFRTDPADRTLVGHSDGAFCAVHAMLRYGDRDDPPFTRFVAVSGDFGKQGLIWAAEERLFYRLYPDGALPASLYLAVGGIEEPRFLETSERLADVLAGRGYAGLRMQRVVYAGEGHGSVVGPAIGAGLRWVFEDAGAARGPASRSPSQHPAPGGFPSAQREDG